VRLAESGSPLEFSVDDQETTLRVNLPEPLLPGRDAKIEITFKGTVPEVDPEETGLLAHVVQQVGAALRSERERRRSRDSNFRCRGVMMLGSAFPLLAARDGDDWQRRVESTIGDTIFAEPADFRVSIQTAPGVSVFTSGVGQAPGKGPTSGDKVAHQFSAGGLRDFVIVASRNMRVAERNVGGVNLRSIYAPEHEVVGRKVLNAGADALRVFTQRFGPLPLKSISIIEAPLVAGMGSVEFSGLACIASAFYVNFDSPQVRNLPELIREQRASVEDSLEWTVAHVVAHQWWGTIVGNDPQRTPVLDEALANYSALLYYREVHGDERASMALDDQLKGVYKVYRTFGGEDMPADRSTRDYRNFFQYSAIVFCKGALMFIELRRLLGDEKFFNALQTYYKTNQFETVELDDLRAAFLAEAPPAQRRAMTRTFSRWLSARRGDQDIALPDSKLAAALGIPAGTRNGDRNAFARLGKFFWQQMTRIR
jgi:hypothetical protein